MRMIRTFHAHDNKPKRDKATCQKPFGCLPNALSSVAKGKEKNEELRLTIDAARLEHEMSLQHQVVLRGSIDELRARSNLCTIEITPKGIATPQREAATHLPLGRQHTAHPMVGKSRKAGIISQTRLVGIEPRGIIVCMKIGGKALQTQPLCHLPCHTRRQHPPQRVRTCLPSGHAGVGSHSRID